MAADALATLEELPFTTRELASATVRAGRQLISRSAAGLAQGAAPHRGLVALRRASMDLNFFLARDGHEVIFFFFKRQLPSVRPLAARLQISLQAAPELTPAQTAATDDAVAVTRAGSEACSYRLLVPPFLMAYPTAEELSLYAPPQTTVENGVLLRIGADGQHVLGIRDPEAEKKAAAVYTRRAQQPLDSWRAEPFLELVETLRSWLASGMATTTEVPLQLPSEPSAMSDVHATLHWFVEAYRSLEAELKSAQAQPVPPPLDTLMPSYQIAEYAAEIKLCIDRFAKFVELKEAQPVSLGMRLTVGRELGGLVARITLSPPDFLISGELRAAFLDELRKNTPAEVRKAVEMTRDSDWLAFLDSASARLVVFRTARDSGGDTDAVVLAGIWRGDLRTLILRTVAKVDMDAKPLSVKLSRVALCYDSQAGQGQTLDDQTVTYFMRLAMALKQWLTVLR